MQTYYDYTLRKWVTRQADGTVRDATNAEALDAYSRGAQAPAGTPGPGSTSPTPALNPATYALQRGQQAAINVGGITYTWDTSTGKYRDPAGHTTEENHAPQTPAATPAAPDPYQGWLGSDPGSRSYRYFDTGTRNYYEQHPDEAYRQYVNSEFGDRQTPLADYARGHYNDYWAQYVQASEGNDKLMYTDTLTNGLADKIRSSFSLQSPTQKGYQLMFQPGGRIT